MRYESSKFKMDFEKLAFTPAYRGDYPSCWDRPMKDLSQDASIPWEQSFLGKIWRGIWGLLAIEPEPEPEPETSFPDQDIFDWI